MKKIAIILMALLLALALCGCAEKKPTVKVTTASNAGDSVKEGAPMGEGEMGLTVEAYNDSYSEPEQDDGLLLPEEGMMPVG